MKIQLDNKALEALFPEGSEARVELQNAVIANFAKKMQERHLEGTTRQQIQEAVRDAGVSMDSYSIVRNMLNKNNHEQWLGCRKCTVEGYFKLGSRRSQLCSPTRSEVDAGYGSVGQ